MDGLHECALPLCVQAQCCPSKRNLALKKVEIKGQSVDGGEVANVPARGERGRELEAFVVVPKLDVPDDAYGAGELFIRGRGRDDGFTVSHSAGSLIHGFLEEVKLEETVGVLKFEPFLVELMREMFFGGVLPFL